ncbi:glutaminyl-peptide cyclotransferase [Microbulbifer yueqingensis]|uniref:Glutamine cyclotransferase n=1 Tax=Microbulbifer yueqingensis TaxID=658219 RepID=A0A1G9ASA1_9GAMM|nr:glutaminyl-peptide cyclotransferase [Microbulbifer yueqingensis]SDK30196.1 Glutamine cyclotransferase [Microbulbifer yueqingensis]
MRRLIIVLALVAACGANAAQAIREVGYELLEQRERPGDHFTQGLYFDGEHWWESSGRYGQSWLARYSDPARPPVRRQWLAPNRFAEGLAVLGDRLFLLTWRAGELQVYRRDDLARIATRHYAGEGWGLTTDGKSLIMSDGSDKLAFRDPDTFAVSRRLRVHGGDADWSNLNELEYAHGLVWANIWQDTRIIAIDPASGEVRAQVDLAGLQPRASGPGAVANGIAWDRARDGLWVTGKLWPRLYLIRPAGLGFGDPRAGDDR